MSPSLKVIWPGVDKFMLSDEELQSDINEFMGLLVAKGADWRFADALEYMQKHAVVDTVEIPLAPLIRFLAKCVCMDAGNINQTLHVVFAFFNGNDQPH